MNRNINFNQFKRFREINSVQNSIEKLKNRIFIKIFIIFKIHYHSYNGKIMK